MSKLRYVKTQEQIAKAKEGNPEFMSSSVSSLRCVYQTDPELARALVPRPLVAADSPDICVTFSNVSIKISEDFTFDIGSAIFGVRVNYENSEGIYLVTMPMTTEQAVVPGRETFGEPKKIADIEFSCEGDRVHSSVSRMGMKYLEVSGQLGQELGARSFTEYGFCYKAMPSCDADVDFDADPLLVRLEWQHQQSSVRKVENAELTVSESPMDPVADLPVRRLVSCEYEVGTTQSNGRVLRSVPGDWLLPYLHQRYDDMSGEGIDIEVAG